MADNFFGKGIPLTSGFDLSAKSPLDSRLVANTLEERDDNVKFNRTKKSSHDRCPAYW